MSLDVTLQCLHAFVTHARARPHTHTHNICAHLQDTRTKNIAVRSCETIEWQGDPIENENALLNARNLFSIADLDASGSPFIPSSSLRPLPASLLSISHARSLFALSHLSLSFSLTDLYKSEGDVQLLCI